MNDSPQKPQFPVKSYTSIWKLGIIGILILILMIPVIWINSLIKERYERRDSVMDEIASKWGAEQIVSGPFISIPYHVSVKVREQRGDIDIEKTVIQTRYLHISPESMNINGKVRGVIQHRGIYKVPGYSAELDLTCSFPADFDTGRFLEKANLDWNNAIVTFDIEDERGLKELSGSFNEQALSFKKSEGVVSVLGVVETEQISPFSSKSITTGKESSFKFEAKTPQSAGIANAKISLHLEMTGTQKLSFLTSALKEQILLQGDWDSPSFIGDILPDTRKITAEGFTATWNTNYLNSGNKPTWTSEEPTIRLSTLGVNFLIMVDSYQQTTRALKYSILFLMLTFMTFFFAETISRQRIHPIQYLMVGCSLILFYLLLLSISEHLSFGVSYLIAAFGVIMQISLYCFTILRTRKFALQVGSILTGVYAFLYVLLRLEDSALLVGSIGLFVLLAIAMYVIRNINWYNQE